MREEKDTCPVCGEGELTEHKEPENFDGDLTVDIIFSLCDTCGAEVTNMTQSVKNKRAVMMAKHGGYDFI